MIKCSKISKKGIQPTPRLLKLSSCQTDMSLQQKTQLRLDVQSMPMKYKYYSLVITMYRLDMENIHCLMPEWQQVHLTCQCPIKFSFHRSIAIGRQGSGLCIAAVPAADGKAIQSHSTPHASVSLERLISSTLSIPITVLFI